MASITRTGKGRRAIQFIGADGKRRTIRLGKVNQRQAEAIKVRVEQLAAAALTGHPVDHDSLNWVMGLDDELHLKLARTGLVAQRTTSTLMGFVDSYITARSDVKESTATVWRRTKRHLIAFFGEDRLLRDITLADSKDFRRYLLSKQSGKRALAEDTVRRTCGIAKQFFEDAFDRGMILRNPFKHRDIPTSTGGGDKSREFFVSRELADQVLELLPDAQWRLMFGLARFGGLRCPSEVLSLRWGDIDWECSRIVVSSPKTEHHEGGESRIIPLFPELRPYLDECYELAACGDEYVITRYRKMDSNYGVLLTKLVERAGLKMWPKPFQNLRATRETELAEEFPMHVVCTWIGNSELIAKKHYLQVTDDHFTRALQNPVQQAPETPRNGSQTVSPAHKKPPVLQGFADTCVGSRCGRMGDEGLEPKQRSSKNVAKRPQTGSEGFGLARAGTLLKLGEFPLERPV